MQNLFSLDCLRSVLQVPFLNLMANIQQRAGHVKVRIGGNTQETAVLVDSTPDGKVIEKAGMGMANVVSLHFSQFVMLLAHFHT